MGKQVVYMPRTSVKRIQIYINKGRKTLSQIRAETGADYLLNGGLFNMAQWRAVCHLKADGYVYAQDPYRYWGYAWETGPDISMDLISADKKCNYIACTALIRGGTALKLSYPPDMGGSRPRSAIGLKGNEICLYCSDSGATPEALCEKLLTFGWESAVMLDGGASSQCDFNGSRVIGGRVVQNLILVYLKKEDESTDKKKYTVCLDPGHGPGCVNGSPDGSYKEHEFAWDMGNRVKAHLERCGIGVAQTRNESGYPELTDRANTCNKSGADLLISLHTNAEAGVGWGTASGLLIYTSAPGDSAGRNQAAKAILTRMGAAGVSIKSTGLFHEGYTVLVKATAPAMLIEYGFHTQKGDVALLKSNVHRDKLAQATAKGVCDYLGVAWRDEQPVEEPWYTGDQEWAKEAGITDGTRPLENITRAEVWAMLHRMK